MDPLGFIIAITAPTAAVLHAYVRLFGPDSYQSRRFGAMRALVMEMLLLRPARLGIVEWDINTWSDSDVLAWKASYLNSCTATSVAGAIFGQIALTALSLPDMANSHWSAPALMEAALMCGVMSVVIASSQSVIVGMLNQAVEVRFWLSSDFDRACTVHDFVRAWTEVNSLQPHSFRLPLRSSLAAQQLVNLPLALLGLSALTFIAGFGVYQGFTWTHGANLGSNTAGNRNVFIVFMVILIIFVFWGLWTLCKEWEQIRMQRGSGFADHVFEGTSHAELQASLKLFQDLRNLMGSSRDPTPSSRQGNGTKLHDTTVATTVSGLSASGSPATNGDHHGQTTERTQHPSSEAGLVNALREAAAAQRACAEASTKVAAEYDRLAAGMGTKPR